MKDRAIRRHHYQRMKAKAEWVLKNMWGHKTLDDRQIGIAVSTHCKSCSCPMCGNPRRYFNELTVQEKKYGIRQRLSEQEGLEEVLQGI